MKAKAFFRNLGPYLRSHYHWVVAAVMFLMIFSYGGAGNNLTSLHIIPVTEELEVGREAFSLAMGAKTLAGMLSTFFSGFLIARMGTRLSSTLGLLVSAGAYYLLANLDSLWMLSLGGGLLGLAAGFCTTSAASHVTRLWFHRYQGTVLGVITAATGIGGSVMCIVQTAAIKAGSFRSSFYLCAGVILAAALLFFLFARNKPEDMGLAPLGEGEQVGRKRRSSAEAFPGFSMKRLWSRPSFYLMMLCTFLSCISMYMAYSTIRSHMIGCGFSEDQASGIHSAMLLILTGTKILAGVLSDRLGAKRVNVIFHVMAVLSLGLFAFVENYGTAIVATVLYTCSLPIVTVGISLIAFSLFGYRAQSEYTGIFLGIITVSNFVADYASNFIFSIAGSYRPAFLTAAGIAAVSMLLFFILYRLCEKDKRLSQAEAA
ncbi:MAG: MFS transporter [Clostridia bacterium]|nr:MFS transporter [Clostridia bacterium]